MYICPLMRKFLTVLALILVCAASYGQKFSGSLDAAGGTSFKGRWVGDAKLRLNYDSDGWFLHGTFSGGYGYGTDTQTKMSLNSKQNLSTLDIEQFVELLSEGTIDKIIYEEKSARSRNWNAVAALDFGFYFNPANTLRGSASYSRSGTSGSSYIQALRFLHSDTPNPDPDLGNAVIYSGLQIDSTHNASSAAKFNLDYVHNFDGPGRNLKLSFDLGYNGNDDWRIRAFVNSETNPYFSDAVSYLTPGDNSRLTGLFDAVYTDPELFSVHALRLKGGLSLKAEGDRDWFCRIQDNGVDPIIQNYRYARLTVEPNLQLDYTVGPVDLTLRERLQRYGHTLYDYDKSATQFSRSEWDNILGASAGFRIGKRQTLTVNYQESLVRPEYAMLTTMVKTTGNVNEYLTGNPDLAPQKNRDVDVRYGYEVRRIFEVYASLHYEYSSDRFERIVKNTTDGVNYYSWINSGERRTPSVRLAVKAALPSFRGELYFQYNNDTYEYKDGSKKSTSNWESVADLALTLPKGWKISAKGGYASRKISAYNEYDAYVRTDLRVTKTFLEKFDVYLEGRDLADRPLYNYTWNEALDYVSVTETVLGRRSAVLGLSIRF